MESCVDPDQTFTSGANGLIWSTLFDLAFSQDINFVFELTEQLLYVRIKGSLRAFQQSSALLGYYMYFITIYSAKLFITSKQ